METKLCSSSQPWIMKKFEGVWVFTSGLDVGFRGAGVAIFVNNSLACHVSKVEKVKGRVLSIHFLFKNKLSVSVIGLYVCVSGGDRFAQTSVINSFIADTINRSFFVVLGGDFNENNSVKRDADEKKWAHFKDLSECVLLDSLNRFKMAEDGGNLDGMLELLVAKLLKVLRRNDTLGFDCLADTWLKVDPSEASKVFGMIGDSVSSAGLINHLSKVRKQYRKSKYCESEMAKRSAIRDAIDKCMEKFEMDKDRMIWSILEQPFCKVVLNHLVVGDSLILEPDEVKLKIDDIIVNWTRKRNALPALSGPWAQQYAPLAYVNDSAFSLVMCDITMCEMSSVISNLPNDKAAGLSVHWKEAWVSMISKPYDWDGVLSNTQPIVLIKMARKILSKVLSDRISFACSRFDVFCGNNFSVLKGTSTQSPISVVGSIVENALQKDCKLWLVLQDMCKAYDSVGWPYLETSLCYIKMCSKFIKFFGNIHNSHFNRVMTDFGLSDEYEGKVFSSLLWRIFYDPLLCEVVRQDHLCGYWINLNFVSKTGRIETSRDMTSFFMAGAFVDDTIWVRNGQASTQHIFNVASEFFFINDININNEKMVAIPINKRVGVPVLSINGQAITVANPSVSHRYLSIFLSTNDLSKPSLAKANSDIKFFSNMVLQKAVSDKQFSYLVSAVLQFIVSYRMQFSFVFKVVCLKWNILIRRGLRSKANLPRDFPNEVLHHPSLYELKSFEQLQAECKTAFVVQFVLCWALLNPLQYPVKLRVNTSNNFLAGVVCIFLDNKLFLDNRLPCVFRSPGRFPISLVLGDPLYFNVVCSLKIAGVAYDDQLLDKNGSIASAYLGNCLHAPPPANLASVYVNVLDLTSFADIYEEIHRLWTDEIDVYTDSSLRNLGMFQMVCGAAVYFPGLNKGLGVEIKGHAGIAGNVLADVLAEQAVYSGVSLQSGLIWEVGPSQEIVSCLFGLVVDWNSSTLVWHPDSHMLSGSTCRATAALRTYFMKAVHFRLPVAVRKRLYNKDYPGVSCLFCDNVELPDHGFTCVKDASVQSDILDDFGDLWKTLMGSNLLSSSFVLRDLFLEVFDVRLYSVFCKGFVLKSWMDEATVSLDDKKKVAVVVVDFIHYLAKNYRTNLWLFRTKFRSDIERSGLIGDDVVVAGALGVGALPYWVSALISV
ncbi:hypothetical protein G9A89_004008 [Geosiphon pyriformis]|nr:hypothetical protein G9A89_004008 [Geosiphon pyriformis]